LCGEHAKLDAIDTAISCTASCAGLRAISPPPMPLIAARGAPVRVTRLARLRTLSTASAQRVKVFARGDAAATSPLSTAAAPLKQSWSSGFRLLVADGPILNTLDQDGVWSVPPTATVSRAVIDMVKYRSGSVIVADQSGMCGIVTERDILDKMPFTVGKSREMTVAQLMTPSDALVTGTESSTLDQCIAAMRAGVFRHLPIVEKRGGAVRAVISIRDVAQHVAGTLKKHPIASAPTVGEMMAAQGGKGCVEVDEGAAVADAVTLMRSTRAGSVLVMGGGSYDDESLVRLGGHLAGIFTERDYLTKVAVYDDASAKELPVAAVMTPGDTVRSVPSSKPVADCLSLMVAGNFRHLPVIDNKDGAPIGVISMRDILQFLLGGG